METHTLSRRTNDLLAAYANDVVRLELRVADLEADVGTYRELVIAGFDALRDLTVKNQTLTNENHQLRDENRALYEALHVQGEADVWAEELEDAPV